jgi:hypothetical protein
VGLLFLGYFIFLYSKEQFMTMTNPLGGYDGMMKHCKASQSQKQFE